MKVNTMAFLCILLLFLLSSYSSCSNIALLINKVGENFEMTCVANKKETITWIPTAVAQDGQSNTSKSEFRSINFKLPPVLDQRWLDFRTYQGLNKEKDVLTDQDVSILHFSLRFKSNINVYLTSDSIKWCASIYQNSTNKIKFKNNCGKNLSSNLSNQWAPWRHYSIFKENNDYFLINSEQSISYKSIAVFKLSKLSLKSKMFYQWKLHEYYMKDYLNQTKLRNEENVSGANLSLFISMCKSCSIEITTDNIRNTITSDGEDKWYQFSPNHSVTHLVYELTLNDNNSFAAIDLRLNYEKSNVIKRPNITEKKISGHGCQDIVNSKIILKYENFEIHDMLENKNNEYDNSKQLEIPSLTNFGMYSSFSCIEYTGKKYCDEYLLCDPKNIVCYCPHGYEGSYCKKKCDDGTWGYKCRNTCSKNCGKKLCHHVVGDCIESCITGYKGQQCNEELGKPYVIQRNATTLTFHVNTKEIPTITNLSQVEPSKTTLINKGNYILDGSYLTIFNLNTATRYKFIITYCGSICIKAEINSLTRCKVFKQSDFLFTPNEKNIEISTLTHLNDCHYKFYNITINNNFHLLDNKGYKKFDNLIPNRNYHIHIASNIPREYDVQNINFTKLVKTKPCRPHKPICSYDKVKEDEVNIKWNITKGPLTKVVINLENEKSTTASTTTKNSSENIGTYKLTKLKPSTSYKVHVYGVNENAESGEACELQIATLPSKPNPQGIIEIFNCNFNKCIVKIPKFPNAENNSYVYIIGSDKRICKNEEMIYNISQIHQLPKKQPNASSMCKWILNKTNTYDTNIETEVEVGGDFEFQAIYVNEFKGAYQITSARPVTFSPKKGGSYFLLLLLVIPMTVALCAYRRYKYQVEIVEDPNERQSIYAPQETPNLMSSKQTEMRRTEVQHFLKNIANKDFTLEDEFKGIESTMGTKEKRNLEQNKINNRYQNVIPYDSTRVILKSNEDYINANYIRGAQGDKSYIATQCPKFITQNDFWEMIWQENIRIIVCLSTLAEGSEKMTQYWPDEISNKMYRNVSVTHEKTEVRTDFNIKLLELTNVASENPSRKVYLFNYVSWPDQSIPLFPLSLLNFAKCINNIHTRENPIVVHCSSGIGRTGTYILCDYYLNNSSADYFDVPKDLHTIRECRQNLVSTLAQYELIYCILDEIINEEDTNFDIDAFASLTYYLIDQFVKSDAEHISRRNYINDILYPKFTNVAFAPEKTRAPKVRPHGPGMLFLSCYPSNDETSSYINAVQVPGYQSKDKYISTQLPMPGTVGDFWRLIYTNRIDLVLALQEGIEDDSTIVDFWPPEGTILTPVDFLEVTLKDTYHEDFHDILTLELYNNKRKECIDIKLIIFKSWKSDEIVPDNLEIFYNFYNYTSKLTSKSPVLLCCYDGAIGCGLYITTNLLLNKMKYDKLFNICWAIRGIRGYREEFVKNEEQMKFLYELALYFVNNHLKQYHDYENPIHEGGQEYYQNIYEIKF